MLQTITYALFVYGFRSVAFIRLLRVIFGDMSENIVIASRDDDVSYKALIAFSFARCQAENYR